MSIQSPEQRSVRDEPVLERSCQMWGVSQRIEVNVSIQELLHHVAVSMSYPSNKQSWSLKSLCWPPKAWIQCRHECGFLLYVINYILCKLMGRKMCFSPVICLFFFVKKKNPLTYWHTQVKVHQDFGGLLTASEIVNTIEVPWGNTFSTWCSVEMYICTWSLMNWYFPMWSHRRV